MKMKLIISRKYCSFVVPAVSFLGLLLLPLTVASPLPRPDSFGSPDHNLLPKHLTAQDVAAFVQIVPDDILKVMKEIFPQMSDAELVEMILLEDHGKLDGLVEMRIAKAGGGGPRPAASGPPPVATAGPPSQKVPRPLRNPTHPPHHHYVLKNPSSSRFNYPSKLLTSADPLGPLNPTHPTPLTTASHFPKLPSAHSRFHLNNPICDILPSTSLSHFGNFNPLNPLTISSGVAHAVAQQSSPGAPQSLSDLPRTTDCSRALSNIIPSTLSPQICIANHPWSTHIRRQTVQEFGTCRVVVENEDGYAGCPDLEKAKELGRRVLRECKVGGERDVRSMVGGGKVGYLFVKEDGYGGNGKGRKGYGGGEDREWGTMWVKLERVRY